MAQTLSDNLLCRAPKQLDDRCGVFSAGAWRPFNDITEFNARFVLAARYVNQTFWMKSTTDPTKASLWALDTAKNPYNVLLIAIKELLEQNVTPIPIIPTIDEDFIIDWQNDLVPNDPLNRKYVERFGNSIGLISNQYDNGVGNSVSIVEFTFTDNLGEIDTVTIPANILNTGFIQILQ